VPEQVRSQHGELTAEPISEELPAEFQSGTLRRRGLQALAALAALGALVLLAPGLADVRHRLESAAPGWIVVAVMLEALSFASYVVLFGPIFCTGLGWRRSWQIAGSELGVGALVPASGIAGLSLGAWVLYRGGMSADRIARRSVAFFLIKSSVNFFAVAIIGALLATGVIGPDLPLWLTALPALAAGAAIVAVIVVARLGEPQPKPHPTRLGTAFTAARRELIRGSGEAIGLLRSGNLRVLGGAIGYWIFDNAVLWACFRAFGHSPALGIVLMGYLIGQLGGLLPLPAGIGGIDLGLIGTLAAYGVPAVSATAAVLAYRVILFWIPLTGGALAFISLRRNMPTSGELAACEPAIAAQTA
jgi:uncharacterized membrane protein YbhN (UPF0104 family)